MSGITVIQWITSVINNVMTTRYITLSAEIGYAMTTSEAAMRFFIEINKFWRR